MNPRFVYLAAAVAGAYLAVPSLGVFAKDDPAKVASDREALKKDYAAAKKYLFADLSYFVDSAKLADSRWEFGAVKEDADPSQGRMFNASLPSGNATDAVPSIVINVFKCIQKDNAKKVEYTYPFKAWGKTIKLADTANFALGHYMDWTLSATDVIKAKCREPDKGGIPSGGPAKLWGYAVGTDAEEKVRQRKDWYVWVNNDKVGAWCWWATATTRDKFIDVKEKTDMIGDLMKNIAETKDGRAHLK
jgi:hypothetical protein